MVPAVWWRVTGRSVVPRCAWLDGYVCLTVQGECFPAVLPRTAAQTQGVLYDGVTSRELKRLDRYEGYLYRRVICAVHVDDSETLNAWIYALRSQYRHRVSARPWSLQQFSDKRLGAYLRGI